MLREEQPALDRRLLNQLKDSVRQVSGEPPHDPAALTGHEAAQLLEEFGMDTDSVSAALATPPALRAGALPRPIAQHLSQQGRQLVETVLTISAIHWEQLDERATEALRHMFLAMAKDLRVVLVLLALRVEMMHRLARSPEPIDAEGLRLAQETLAVFAPLANRLGIWLFKSELEDSSFRILEPQAHKQLTELLCEKSEQRQSFIDQALLELKTELSQTGINAEVSGRSKHLFSIYRKMQRKQVNFDQIYDVSAVRVITNELADCYAVLGIVHSMWVPIPNEFDDYIAMPKNNGYQSLHTVVIGPQGRPLEVQIRTREMHEFGERGVAAHWAYKEGRAQSKRPDRFMLLRQLIDWDKEMIDSSQFAESLRTDLFEDRVYVFTPAGQVLDLPRGATPLDFAYRVHTMVGHRCRGARVNDQIVPLDRPLKNGDRVEILTHKAPQPSRDWMNPNFGYLQTASARAKLRHWFKEQGRDEAVRAGKELVQKELARLELRHISLDQIAEHLKCESVDELLASVGFGERRPQSVATAALELERENSLPAGDELPPSVPPSRIKPAPSGLVMDDIESVAGNRARCCNPVPGDDVVGFVTRGRGVVIHRRDCSNIQDSPEPERLVEISWGPRDGQHHTVGIELEASDGQAVNVDILQVLTHMNVRVTSAKAQAQGGGSQRLRYTLELLSAQQLAQVIARLSRHPGVSTVRRISK